MALCATLQSGVPAWTTPNSPTEWDPCPGQASPPLLPTSTLIRVLRHYTSSLVHQEGSTSSSHPPHYSHPSMWHLGGQPATAEPGSW